MNAWRRCLNGLLGIFLGASLLSGCQSPENKQVDGVWGQGKKTKADLPSGKLPELKNLNIPEEGERRIEPETYLAAARLHESLGNNVEAVEQYQKAINQKANYTEALNGLANLHVRMGRFQEAEEAYGRAINSAADKAYLWNNRAFCYLMQRRWSEAEADLRYALEICPDFGRARINYAMVLAQQDRFDEAFTQFRMVLPEANAHYNIGLMYQSRRKPTEAAEAYRQALALNPQLVAAQKRLEKLSEAATAYPTNEQDLASPLPMQMTTVNEQATTRPAMENAENTIDKQGASSSGDHPSLSSSGSAPVELYVPAKKTASSIHSEDLFPSWSTWLIQADE